MMFISVENEKHEAQARTSANETVASNILATNYRLKEKAVLGVFGDPQISHAWSNEVCRDFDIDWHSIALLLSKNEVFHSA